MNNKILAIAMTMFGICELSAQSWPAVNPEAKPGARWWWLGSAVTEKDLQWNISEYAKTGIGALEITPIYGVQGNDKNNLSFLSAPWMKALDFTETEGSKNGVLIDMNNGTGWPFGGPEVPISEAAAKLAYTDTIITGKVLRTGIDISIIDKKEKMYATLSKVMAYSTQGVTDLTEMTDANGIVNGLKHRRRKTTASSLFTVHEHANR